MAISKQNSPQRKVSISGARESNAGDEFHVLWASQRALKLIEPNTDFKLLVMEDLSPGDTINFEGEEAYFLGADLTEYYGGNDFINATRIIIAQLKYSTRHPDTAWTASRLCAISSDTSSKSIKKKDKWKKSVVGRLANLYLGFATKYPLAEIILKLKIELVSNQPVAPTLQQALLETQELLAVNPASPIEQLSKELEKIVNLLKNEAKLSNEQISGFLQILSLDSCGVVGLEQQRLQLGGELAASIKSEHENALSDLCNRIRKEALPKNSSISGLTAKDILVCLGVGSYDRLFPANPSLELPENLINRNTTEALADCVIHTVSNKILLHGEAGVGKSTTVQAFSNYLPANSSVFIYDCYGSSSYLNVGNERYILRRFITQITNEIAIKFRTPLLLRPANNIEDMWRDFQNYLKLAADVVASENGLLVIVVDAADNAIYAARHFRGEDQCFLPGLWSLQLPANCRLVITCRTHRRSELQLPKAVKDFELAGFDEVASANFLRNYYPDAKTESVSLFHEKTGGNPRVQKYTVSELLKLNQADLANQMKVMAKKSLQQIFQTQFNEVIDHSVDVHAVKLNLAILMCLPRPFTLKFFAAACEIPDENAITLCKSLTPGIYHSNGQVLFRDEDFESFLRQELEEWQSYAYHTIAKYCLTCHSKDEYASSIIAEQLFHAQMLTDLINLVLNEAIPKIITDEIIRIELARSRVKRALHAAAVLKRTDKIVQLLIIAAEINSSNYTIGQIIEDYTELALRYGDSNKVKKQLLESDSQYKTSNNWFGGTHYKLAALFARLSEEQQAKDHLASGHAWLKHYAKRRKEKEWYYIENKDIGYAAEAIYRLHGLSEALRWLRRLHPRSNIVNIIYELLQTSDYNFDTGLLETEFIRLKMPYWVKVMAISAMWSTGQTFSVAFVDNTLNELVSRLQTRGTIFYKRYLKERWLIDFCETALYHKLDSTQILAVLETLSPKFPSHRLYDAPQFSSNYELPFKASCLAATLKGTILNFKELVKKFNEHTNKGEHTPEYALESSVGILLPIYNQYTQMLIDPTTLTIDEIKADIEKWREIRKHRWFNKDRKGQYFWIWAEKTVETIILSPNSLFSLLNSIADLAQEMGMAPFVWRRMAKLLFRQERYQAFAYSLIERAVLLVVVTPMSANERWSFLLECSELVLARDKNLAQDYYRRALEIASGIDDEYARLIALQAQMALQLAQTQKCQQPDRIADQLIQVIEEYEPYVSTEDRLAWKEVLASVTRLNVNKGLALVSRWDDERRYLIREGVVQITQQGVVSGTILPSQSLAMLKLAGEGDNLTYSAKPILEYLKDKGNRNELRLFIEELGNQILLDTNQERKPQAVTELVDWIDANKLGSIDKFEQVRRVQSFLETLNAKSESSHSTKIESSKINPEDWLEKAHSGDFSNLEVSLKALENEKAILEYLKVLGFSILPSQRELYLEKLSSLDLNSWLTKTLAKALLYQLEQWAEITTVKSWLVTGLDKFFAKNLSKLLLCYYYETLEVLQVVGKLAALGNISLSEAIVPVVVKNLETMGGQLLCSIVSGLCLILEPIELETVLVWALNHSLARLPATDRKPQTSNVPDNFDASLAGLIWSLLGHSNKAMRWQAIHMSRQLLKIQSEPLLTELVRLAKTENAGAFRTNANDRIFYWLSARIYLMVLFSKLAREQPKLLVPHIQAIANHTLSPDLPHAQIREFAKDTVFSVIKEFPNVLPEGTIQEIRLVNTPRACLFPRGERWSMDKPTKELPNRFNFSDDTIRYWYSGIMGVFGYKQNVTFQADKWISDNWGFTNEDWQHDPRELYDGYEGSAFYNDHGKIPKIEILRNYLEYHAMMCVAGELISQIPVAVSTWSDENDLWSNWLTQHTSVENEYWLSDLRSATPLRADCWGNFSSLKDWQRHQETGVYLQELGLENPDYPKQIVISGSLSMYNSEQRKYIQIKSALVTPETARALLYALQNVQHISDYNLPILPSNDFQISEEMFELSPIIEKQRFNSSLDKYDPFLPREDLELKNLSQDFLQQLNLTQVPGTLNYQLSNGKPAVKLELWQDGVEEKHIIYPRTNGQRLWVDLDVLLNYLHMVGKDLIFEVLINRRKSERNYKEQEKYDSRTARLFLLRANGTLETVDEHRQIRPLNCS